jgi:hypothetical protein
MFPRTTVAVIALLGTASALPSDVAPVHKRADKNTYDYVIVGGGITGLVAANRLSEDKKSKSVIVLRLPKVRLSGFLQHQRQLPLASVMLT